MDGGTNPSGLVSVCIQVPISATILSRTLYVVTRLLTCMCMLCIINQANVDPFFCCYFVSFDYRQKFHGKCEFAWSVGWSSSSCDYFYSRGFSTHVRRLF